MQKNPTAENIELRMRILNTLWVALFWSIFLYYAVTFFVTRPEDNERNNTLFLVLIAIAITTTLIAFLIKQNFLSRAAERQQVELVQQGYIVTWALTEVSGLLGLLDYFATRNPYYYVLFIIAVVGMLIHFPRRAHVLNAAYKHPGF